MIKYIFYIKSLTCIAAALFAANSMAQTVFADNFNQNIGDTIASSGNPAVDYTLYTTVTLPEQGGGTAVIEEYTSGDGIVKLLARENTSQSGNRTEVSAPLSDYNLPFKPILNENTGTLSWIFTARQNRSSGGGTSGFNGTNTGMAVVLVSDSSNWDTQLGSLAKGYAITFLKPGGNMYAVSLSRFDGGLSNYTVIAGNKLDDVFSELRTWITVKVTYHPATNQWNLFFRDEQTMATKGEISNGAGLRHIESAVDSTFTALEMSHFGFALNTPSPGASGANGNAFFVDDFVASIFDDNQLFTLQTSVIGDGGHITTAPDLPEYPAGSQVELTAVADSGYVFTGWGSDLTGSENPLLVSVYSDLNVTASFAVIEEPVDVDSLIHYDVAFLNAVKAEIAKGNSFFVSAYNTLITNADKELTKAANPVTNKTQVPPSGSKHDYLSLAPYWWPNPDTENGLPWVNRDGEVNPLTRGDNTDQVRLSNFFSAIELLSFAFYFSDDIKYANKAIDLINIWFIDSATKVNPNVNYGQGIPGLNDGRRFGIIEWSGFSNVIAALQILDAKEVLPSDTKIAMQDWIGEFSTWMTTSTFGIEEGNTDNNHGTWYDYQVMGLLLYTGNTVDAQAIANTFKTKRIAAHIEPDGSQPHELSRTKSVSYFSMNLRALTLVAQMGWQTGVDLWSYETSDGRSIRKAYEFLLPYVLGEKTWTWQHIGGATEALNSIAKPLLSQASTIFREDLIAQSENAGNGLSYLSRLKYPPREKLFIGDEGKAYIFITVDPDQGTVSRNPDLPDYTPGEDLVLTAEPKPGFLFENWTGDIVSDENPLMVKMDSVIRITANFTPVYTVAISTNTVNGSIDISPLKDYYLAGETITFTPIPAPGYSFGSWFAEGGINGSTTPLVITINRNIEITAHFNLITYLLFVTANNGVVTKNPSSSVYPAGTKVELTATPDEGFEFTAWSGFVTSQDNPFTSTMDSVIYVTANFDQTIGINESKNALIHIYPNPSQGIFNVEINQKAHYTIYNLSGIRLMTGEESNKFELDLKGYPKGIYLLEIMTQNEVVVKRIILE